MTQKSAEENDNFYAELDKKTINQSCCTCQTLIILFVIILFLVSGGVFYLYLQVTKGSGIFLNRNTKTEKIDTKLESVKSQNGRYSLIITDNEMRDSLNDGITLQNFVLKDVDTAINPLEILISGILVQPLNSKVVISVLPKAENGKLKFTVSKITTGSINLPKIFNQRVSETINSIFDKKMDKFYKNNIIEEVELKDNQMEIKGKIKK